MDKNKVVMIAVGAGITGLLIGLAVGAFGHNGRGGDRYGKDMMGRGNDGGSVVEDNKGKMKEGKEVAKRMDSTMGMDHGAMGEGIMAESEREFIMGMIPHHEEAIVSAKEVVARGGSTAEIKTLAENIIIAQEAEVAQMKGWYKNWYGVDYVANNNYPSMMSPIADLSGAALDKVFLTDMIKHHKMAIMMANSVDAHIEHDEMKTFSNNIKTTQSAEIETMQNLLNVLN